MQQSRDEALKQHFQAWAIIQTPPYSLVQLRTRDSPYKSLTTHHAWRGYQAGATAEHTGADVKETFELWAEKIYLLERTKGKPPKYKHAGTFHAFAGFKAAFERQYPPFSAPSAADPVLLEEVVSLRDTVRQLQARLSKLENLVAQQHRPAPVRHTHPDMPGLR